eukprot:Lankesteria_metandrocarpae@DN5634_c0_g1_i1.p1
MRGGQIINREQQEWTPGSYGQFTPTEAGNYQAPPPPVGNVSFAGHFDKRRTIHDQQVGTPHSGVMLNCDDSQPAFSNPKVNLPHWNRDQGKSDQNGDSLKNPQYYYTSPSNVDDDDSARVAVTNPVSPSTPDASHYWERFVESAERHKQKERIRRQRWLEATWELQKLEEQQLATSVASQHKVLTAERDALWQLLQQQKADEVMRQRQLEKAREEAAYQWQRREAERSYGKPQFGGTVSAEESRDAFADRSTPVHVGGGHTAPTVGHNNASLLQDPWGGIGKVSHTHQKSALANQPDRPRPDYRRRYALRATTTAEAWTSQAWGG